ncbi:MAG: winged helix-turn-helix domain-containing protein [Anaerolineaceae bacterium]|nr:winged helix-turn-helix domain-containing protein [Anaerolineaceae bacterium]
MYNYLILKLGVIMTIWDAYPSNYRNSEISRILSSVKAGESCCLLGLSGSGKSNLVGFLAERVKEGPQFILVDCNRLPQSDPTALFGAIQQSFSPGQPADASLPALFKTVHQAFADFPQGICFILDRFEAFDPATPAFQQLAANLRALRDQFKYQVTYLISSRRPLEASSELAELFFANTFWLGPLSQQDALWSITQYAQRKALSWSEAECQHIFTLSGGYSSLLRAICEAHAAGTPLEVAALLTHPAIQARLQEFWHDAPDQRALEESGLADHPFFTTSPSATPTALLTALEQRLLDSLSAHPGQVCEKDALIQAVWPEEKWIAGMRDDSLAQLVHRLREKIDTPQQKHIQSIPSRGYVYTPDPPLSK